MAFFELYRGVVSGLLGALFFGLGSAVFRLVGEELDVISMNFLRSILGFLFFVIIALFIGDLATILTLSGYILLMLALSIIFNVVIGDTSYFRSQNLIGVSRAFPITNLTPLFTLFFAVIFLQELITPRILSGVLLVVGGVYFIAQPREQESIEPTQSSQSTNQNLRMKKIGLGLALLSALCWTGGTLTLRVAMTADIGVISANSLRFGFAILFFGLISSSKKSGAKSIRNLRSLSRKTIQIVLIATILNVMLGALFWVDSVKYAGASKSATYIATSPLFALPVAIKYVGETISWKILIGTLMTIIGVYLVL